MKITILVSVAIFTSFRLFAQANSATKTMNEDIMKDNMATINKQNINRRKELENKETIGVTMKNGKMMTLRDNKTRLMKRNVTLRNGTIVMPSGLVLKADKTAIMMQEGESVDMYGKIEFSNKLQKIIKKY